jgi:hypothetical protein
MGTDLFTFGSPSRVQHLARLICFLALVALWAATTCPALASVKAGEPPVVETETLEAASGISTAQAEARLAIQHRATKVNIVGQLEESLGKEYAGVWFDNEAGEFVVPVLAAPTGKIATASDTNIVDREFAAAGLVTDYRVEVAQFSREELEAAQLQLGETLSAFLDRGLVQTALDPSTNAVIVRVPAELNAATLATIEQLVKEAAVKVEIRQLPASAFKLEPAACSEVERKCTLPMRGGTVIYGGEWTGPKGETLSEVCTAAFRANGYDGKKYILTAGHCATRNAEANGIPNWSWITQTPSSGTKQSVGTMNQWHYPGKDWAKIDATGSWADTSPWPTMLAYWGGTEEYPIVGEAKSYKGQTLCHIGMNTGTSCGIVREENVTVEYFDGSKLNSMFEVVGKGLALGGGDSGGPVIANNIALGILSGGVSAYSNATMYFSDIIAAEAELNVNITGPGAPEAITGAATNVQGYQATISGQVNPHGLETSYHFEYGQGSYTNSTSGASAGAGQGFVSTSATPTGLDPYASYKYRLVAGNALNTAYGSEGTFNTPPVPPIVTTQPASNISGTAASANATVDPEGAPTNYYIEYGTTASYGSKTAEIAAGSGRQPVNVSLSLSGLEFGANYHFRVVATSVGGTSKGADLTFTPGWRRTTVPMAAGVKQPAFLSDVDCTSAAFCMAVGPGAGTGAEAPGQGVVSDWIGGAWESETIPIPTGKVWAQLAGVDCLSQLDCWAVGSTGTGDYKAPRNPLVAHWNGSNWESSSIASPPGMYNALLTSVSCAAANSCIASGFTQATSGGMFGEVAMRWNGVTWALTTNPSGAMPWTSLASTECRAPSDCFMPGSMNDPINKPEIIPFVNHWDGSAWTREVISGKSLMWFNSIDCIPAQGCIAAGVGKVGSQPTPFVGNLVGATWNVTALPQLLAPGETAGYLHDISCNAPANCETVGHVEAPGVAGPPMSARIVPSGSWERQTLPFLGASGPRLNAVSCPSPTFCAAVGQNGYSASEEPMAAVYAKYDAPILATKPPSGAEGTQATLNGTVDPYGSETTYYFEYGSTTAYGSKTPQRVVSAGSNPANASEPITGLTSGQVVHYRLVAANAAGSVFTRDREFIADSSKVAQFSAMKVTEPFNGTAGGAVSSYAADWAMLPWAASKGTNSATGWTPETFSTVTGASYQRGVTDVGSGTAAQVTMALNPGLASRYFSIWDDIPSGASTRTGYQLKFVKAGESGNQYNVTLAKWSTGAEVLLGSKAGVPLDNGQVIAIADQGGTVSAWTDTGKGMALLLNASDSTYASGQAAVEGSGSNTRLTNFKTGTLQSGASNMNAALNQLRLDDSFLASESPLSESGTWSALLWASAMSGHNTGRTEAGWGPYDSFNNLNGAYRNTATFAETGSGAAAAATMKERPTQAQGRHFELLIDMPNPGSVRSGYEARFTENTAGVFDVMLAKYQAGAQTVLGTKASYSFPVTSKLALVDKAGTVSIWTAVGAGEWTQLLAAADTTFASGYSGVAGSGNVTRLTNFRTGQLPPF